MSTVSSPSVMVTRMVAVPIRLPVTLPYSSTEAIAGSEETKVTS